MAKFKKCILSHKECLNCKERSSSNLITIKCWGDERDFTLCKKCCEKYDVGKHTYPEMEKLRDQKVKEFNEWNQDAQDIEFSIKLNTNFQPYNKPEYDYQPKMSATFYWYDTDLKPQESIAVDKCYFKDILTKIRDTFNCSDYIFKFTMEYDSTSLSDQYGCGYLTAIIEEVFVNCLVSKKDTKITKKEWF